ncbi:RNA-binding protein, putative [Trypanosoma vivax Y486]|uniref:RNA-binding protein, putative n=1 Tax=Trypanosoma vivax (strain Y486) TaxID=1055687 RepID=F9WSB0_TRYVY|nr:RNA-binding protein, putative [Trypanosoma vivax Y486]|eukprot:CCD20449.1 RNA-binding protein, putative [Trypanosoma vivax Y486]
MGRYAVRVSGLPEGKNEDDVREFFSRMGTVVYCKVKGTGATVEYENEDDYRDALNLNGVEFVDGYTIKVENESSTNDERNASGSAGCNTDSNGDAFAGSGEAGNSEGRPQYFEDFKVAVRRLPDNATEQQLRDLFEEYGKITDFFMESNRRYAFVGFENAECLEAALQANGRELNGSIIEVEKKRSGVRDLMDCKIVMKGLPPAVKQDMTFALSFPAWESRLTYLSTTRSNLPSWALPTRKCVVRLYSSTAQSLMVIEFKLNVASGRDASNATRRDTWLFNAVWLTNTAATVGAWATRHGTAVFSCGHTTAVPTTMVTMVARWAAIAAWITAGAWTMTGAEITIDVVTMTGVGTLTGEVIWIGVVKWTGVVTLTGELTLTGVVTTTGDLKTTDAAQGRVLSRTSATTVVVLEAGAPSDLFVNVTGVEAEAAASPGAATRGTATATGGAIVKVLKLLEQASKWLCSHLCIHAYCLASFPHLQCVLRSPQQQLATCSLCYCCKQK